MPDSDRMVAVDNLNVWRLFFGRQTGVTTR
jgi:hypothetical protein